MFQQREIEIAEMESARNYASEQYFDARKDLWSKRKQKVFDDGFERAWYYLKNKSETASAREIK